MSKNQSVLSCGASLDRAVAAYFDGHPLDHDDDIQAEHGAHAFDFGYDDSNINTTAGLQG